MKKTYFWEKLPFYLIYTPFLFVWVYYWIKSKHFWFFSNVNPTMHFSGFEGEGKEEMFQQLPCGLFPATIYVQSNENLERVLIRMKNAGLQFPVAVKPDVGTKGLLFRKIENEKQLAQYNALLPFTYLIQQLITFPLELSIFYVRYPNRKKGVITGLIAKEYLHVKGDGKSTIKQLIEKHPKAFMMAEEQKHKHKKNLNITLKKDEIFLLNELGNHNRGARFINLQNKIDDELSCTIDGINNFSKHFFYGRYDIKTTSLDDLKKGKNISILEFNGVGSEPNHIYDIGLTYKQAMKVIVQHWKYMYEIGNINYKKGIKYISFLKGIKMVNVSKQNTRLLKKLDLQCNLN